MFAVLNHNMSTSARIRYVVTNSETDVVLDRVYDSGLIPVWVPTVGFGTLPWGVMPWDGISTDGYPGGTICFHLAPEPYYGRYIFIYIEDTANPSGYIEIGRFLAGEAWSPAINMSYGAAIQVVDPSESRRTRGGRKIVQERPKYRTLNLTLEDQNQYDSLSVVFEISRQVGKGGNMLVVYDVDDNSSILFRRTFYGSLVDTAPISQTYYDSYSTEFSLEELI
jgi:hypothetical protein